LEIFQATAPQDTEEISNLTHEYLVWTKTQMKEQFKEDLDIESMLAYSMSELKTYMPPEGRLLLAKIDSSVVGVAFLRRIDIKTCEIKRMFVQPGYRGKRIGYNLLTNLISSARDSGYSEVLLDSGKFMSHAHDLYRTFGFKDIEKYPQSEVGENYETHMVFMSLAL
jgi:GNAT superfamily N-acetyltransferase